MIGNDGRGVKLYRVGSTAKWVLAQALPFSASLVVAACEHRLKAEDLSPCEGYAPGDTVQIIAAQADVGRPTVVLTAADIAEARAFSLPLSRADDAHTPEVLELPESPDGQLEYAPSSASNVCLDAETGSAIPREIDGFVIPQRAPDGYVSAAAMCQASGTKMNDYARLAGTQAFIEALESVAGIPATLLVVTTQHGVASEQGTWVHPKVAIHLAQWCSAKFAGLVAVCFGNGSLAKTIAIRASFRRCQQRRDERRSPLNGAADSSGALSRPLCST